MTSPTDIKQPPQNATKPYPSLLFATVLLLVPQPLFLFYVFCCPQFSNFSQRAANGGLLALCITLCWFIIWTKAVWELLKDMLHSKTSKMVAIVAAFFFNGLLLGALAIQRNSVASLRGLRDNHPQRRLFKEVRLRAYSAARVHYPLCRASCTQDSHTKGVQACQGPHFKDGRWLSNGNGGLQATRGKRLIH